MRDPSRIDATTRSPRRWRVIFGAAAAAGLAAWLIWPERGRQTPIASVDRSHHTTASLQPKPEYAGTESCASCHAEQFESYRHTAHSRAFGVVDPGAEPPDGEFHHEPSRRDYEVYRKDGRLRHREMLRDAQGDLIAQADHPLEWLVGSGRHSRTYLIETDGYLAESPVTWYASRGAWAMSPGYDQPQHQSFERAADWGCLYCHVGRAEPMEGAYHRLNVIEPAIGCERCHGPGAGHAARHRDGEESATDRIVHPANLPRDRQEDICAQCHLRGESTVALTGRSLDDFLPGMRLADVRLDYRIKSPDEPMKVVGHVEQMRLSACYIKSDTLTCTTCHDMHAPLQPEEAIGFYRQRCLDCHAEQDCELATAERLKQNPHDNCAACHMPQVETDIPHIAFTHHRIGFHFPAALEPESDAASSAGAGELVAYGDVSHVSGTEQARCLGLAYLEAHSKSRGRRESNEYGRRARQLLESALAQAPADGEVAAALAKLDWLENPPRALELAQKALSDPRTSSSSRVNALFIAANVLFENNQSEAAMAPLQELTRLRRIAEDHLLLAACQAEAGEFADAEKTALTSLQIDPFRADVHELLARLAERQGNAAAAKTYQQTAEKLQAVPK